MKGGRVKMLRSEVSNLKGASQTGDQFVNKLNRCDWVEGAEERRKILLENDT